MTANSLPRISVITPSFNQGSFLEETIHSVLNQQYPNLEYIIIDGGSTDKSIEVIRNYQSSLAYWVNEPDRGQAHAINKGIERATGDIIGFLNSDDTYLPGALIAVGHYYKNHPKARWICGHSIMHGLAGRPSNFVKIRVPRSLGEVLFGSMAAISTSSFWRREIFEDNGKFAENMRYCFDIDFYARLLSVKEKCLPLDFPVSTYRLHPNSKSVAESASFRREMMTVRDSYLANVPWWEVQYELARERWERAEWLLFSAIEKWRSGSRREGVALGIRTLRLTPTGTVINGWKWLRRLVSHGSQ